MTEPSKFAAVVAPVVSKAAVAAERGGAAVALWGGFTATELAAFGGLIVAIIGFVVNTAMNWHFKSQHLRLAREKAKADPDE